MAEKILIVDDDRRNLMVLEALLIPMGYEILLASDGIEAVETAGKESPDLILMDIMMPRLNGYEATKQLKGANETSMIPIVMVTALKEVEDRVRALEVGADDFLSKPIDKTELRARVKSLLKVKAYNDYMLDQQKELEEAVDLRTKQLKEALEQVKEASLESIYRLTRASEYKDENTAAHIMRVSHYAKEVAIKMGLSENEADLLLYASPMHDVGKIGIPDRVLLKPGKLDPDEWVIMKQHPIIGKKILENSKRDYIKLAEEIAISHHEKWDGSGYPYGLKGSDIPLSGRIIAVVDVFDALSSDRPYRKQPFPLDKIYIMLKEGRGKHFDPDVLDAFFAIEDQILAIKEKIQDKSISLLFQITESIGKNQKGEKL
ncbi:MAG: response regulator [Spirochaetaceae bacterium]